MGNLKMSSIVDEKAEFDPKNEQGVFYLFARNHEKLGFKKIVSIHQRSPPDIVAITNDGQKVNIELEHKFSKVAEHYRVLSKKERGESEKRYIWNEKTEWFPGEWIREGKTWKFMYNGQVILNKEDLNDLYWVPKKRGILLYKTLKAREKGKIDIIMYWEKDKDAKDWEFDEGGVIQFDLKKRLSEINIPRTP